MVVSWAAGWLFWWQGHNTMALVWLGLHTTQLLRYPYQVAYFKDPNAGEHSPLWARRHRTEMLWYSGTWGLAPWLILPGADTSMTAVLVLIVLGVTSTGIPAVAPRWASVMCFALPMVLSLSAALLWQGDMVHVFLAVSCLAYLGVTLHIARSQHALLAQTLQSRFEKEALATELEQQVRLTRQASEEKTRFLAAASHDLRQPLHAIGLFGASLERELQGHPVHPQAVFLQEAVRSVHTSLGAMLDISRLDAGVVAPVRQPVALQDILLSLQRTFGQRADEKGLTLRIRSSPLRVNTDPQMLDAWLSDRTHGVLDLCTGNGSLAVIAAMAYPDVVVDAADISQDALDVARINVDKHKLTNRITLIQSDLLDAVRGPYDLILCNPPYVNSHSMAALPAEYQAEPALALAGGDDGMDLVRRIVQTAADKLNPEGVLVLEIGNERAHFEHAFRRLEVAWLDTSAGDDQVLLVTRDALVKWSRK